MTQAATAPQTADIPVLPGLRQDLQLLPGELQSDGVPSWRIHDPVRNRFFDIGWIEFELLQRWREGATGAELIAEVCASTPLHPTTEELASLAIFLDQHQLLAPSTASRRDSLKRRSAARKLPLWKQLLHHYLFFRIPLLRPDAWLERIVPVSDWLFGRFFLTFTLAAGLSGVFLASRQSDALSTAFGYFFNLEGMLFYALATSVAMDIEGRCGAGYDEKNTERLNSRNGYRERTWDTRVAADRKLTS